MPQSEVAKLELRVIERVLDEPTTESTPPSRGQATLTVHPSFAASTRSSPVRVLEEVELPEAMDPRLTVLCEPDSVGARNYRLLQHRLVARSDPRVIAVTSAWPGEGKTTCAANLALVMADQTFARVLLIDANVQRPALAQTFGFQPADSFIDRLTQNRETRPPYLVARIRGSRLHVAAPRVDTPRGAHLDRLQVNLALSELRFCYDYIIIDSAAVFESADADVIAESVDAIILTARAGHSRRTAIRRAIEQLSPTPVLGVVLLDT